MRWLVVIGDTMDVSLHSSPHRLLFMRDRTGEGPIDYGYQDAVQMVQAQTGLDQDSANLFHAEIWIAVHGIAVMFATSYLDWDMELVSRMLTDFYQGLKSRQITE